MIRAPKTATVPSANVGLDCSGFISHPPLAVHCSFHWTARSWKGKIRRFISYLRPGVGLKKCQGWQHWRQLIDCLDGSLTAGRSRENGRENLRPGGPKHLLGRELAETVGFRAATPERKAVHARPQEVSATN